MIFVTKFCLVADDNNNNNNNKNNNNNIDMVKALELNPQIAEIFLYKPWKPKVFLNLKSS